MGCRCAKPKDPAHRECDDAPTPARPEPEPEQGLLDAGELHDVAQPVPPTGAWHVGATVVVQQDICWRDPDSGEPHELSEGACGEIREIDVTGEVFVDWEQRPSSWFPLEHVDRVHVYTAGDTAQTKAVGSHSGASSPGPQRLNRTAMSEGSRRLLEQSVPLRVLHFPVLEALGHLPRSTSCAATLPDGTVCNSRHDFLLDEVTDDWNLQARPVVLVSHSWIEPSKSRPDTDWNSKFDIVVRGIHRLCQEHSVSPGSMYVFLDWCCIDQDSYGTPLFTKYVNSMPAFIAQMSFVLIPLDAMLLLEDPLRVDSEGCPVLMNWEHYSRRGWCRMEMLAGRALAAMGTQMRVYRFDATWGPGQEKLIEVPPYTPGSLGIMPSAPDALFTCCECDHWNPTKGGAITCDREAVRLLEEVFATIVRNETGNRRSRFLQHFGSLLALPDDLQGGIVAVPAATFLAADELPRAGGQALAVPLSDEDLKDKRLLCFAHRCWRPGMHPDVSTNLKLRWMKQVLNSLVDQEGLLLESVYVWVDYCSVDQDHPQAEHIAWQALPALVARATYFVVLETDRAGNSDGALDFARVRNCIFVSRLMFTRGIYTATYVTRLRDLNSLNGMTLDPLQCLPIDPKAYEVFIDDQWDLDGCGPVSHKGHSDPLCPWTGRLSGNETRQAIMAQSKLLLEALIRMDGTEDVREQLINHCQSKMDTIAFAQHPGQPAKIVSQE